MCRNTGSVCTARCSCITPAPLMRGLWGWLGFLMRLHDQCLTACPTIIDLCFHAIHLCVQGSLPRMHRRMTSRPGPDSPFSSAASSPSLPFAPTEDGTPYASPSSYSPSASGFYASQPTTPVAGSATNGYSSTGPGMRTPSRTFRHHSSGSLSEGPGTPGGAGTVIEMVAAEDLQPCSHPEADLEGVLQVRIGRMACFSTQPKMQHRRQSTCSLLMTAKSAGHEPPRLSLHYKGPGFAGCHPLNEFTCPAHVRLFLPLRLMDQGCRGGLASVLQVCARHMGPALVPVPTCSTTRGCMRALGIQSVQAETVAVLS